MTEVKEKKKLCWVIGETVEEYSLSPGMHQVIYDELGVTGWGYSAKNIADEKELKEFVGMVRNNNEAVGFNVTAPYKQDIMKYLDDMTGTVKVIGAVNTVFKRNGNLEGLNTDWPGFRKDLVESLDFKQKISSAVVIGAGGAGRAVVRGLYDKVSHVHVYDIDIKKAEAIASSFKRPPLPFVIENKNQLYDKLKDAELLVNASTSGRDPGEPPVSLKGTDIRQNLKIYDVNYTRKTELMRDGEELGLKVAGGIGMLARQGAEAFSWWRYVLGLTPGPVDIEEEIIEKMKEYIRREVIKND